MRRAHRADDVAVALGDPAHVARGRKSFATTRTDTQARQLSQAGR